MTAAEPKSAKPGWRDALTVYLKPRVLIVLFLGFSAGLPLALSGATLLVWMREAGVNLGTIGLFALVGTPYTREIHLGAAGRCARRAGAVAPARPPPRLAGVLAGAADRGDRVPRPDRSGGRAVAGGARRAAGRDGVGDPGHRDRRIPGREPRRKRAGRRHGLLCRGLPGRHAGVDRGRAVHGVGLRVARPRPPRRLERRLRRDGGAGADRHRHHADRDRAGKVDAGPTPPTPARTGCSVSPRRRSARSRISCRAISPGRRSSSSSCSSSPTRWPAA